MPIALTDFYRFQEIKIHIIPYIPNGDGNYRQHLSLENDYPQDVLI